MFGDFLQQFGLDFQLSDPATQVGLLGLNTLQPTQPSVGTAPPPMAAPAGDVGGAKTPPATAATAAPPASASPPPAAPQQQPQSSPLASPLAPGQSQLGPLQNEPAPAAGVGSQFIGGKI